jgi:nucleoside-diphosphate-sugar epimerase
VTVVVTGVAGFIGSNLAQELLRRSEQVVGIDCLTDYYDRSLKEANLDLLRPDSRFRFQPLDLAVDDLRPVLAGATHVYHLAAQAGVRQSWGDSFAPYVRHNIVATQRLLEQLRGSTARLVFASSSSVYGDADHYPTQEDVTPRPVSPYGVTKLCSEQLVMAYRRSAGIDARCLRYFTVYGPRQRPDMAFSKFIAAAGRGDAIEVYGDGEQVRDFTFVSDAVEATIRAGAVDDPAEAIFNVGGGSRVTLRHVIELLGDVLGAPVAVRHLPVQAGDVRETGADLHRSEAVLQWHPRVPLEEGLRAQAAAATRAGD